MVRVKLVCAGRGQVVVQIADESLRKRIVGIVCARPLGGKASRAARYFRVFAKGIPTNL